jgi:3-oxoacyl-[acyl-carrier protein] reductase
MDLGITGKVAVVAAASEGLGRAAAEALAAEGANLVICSRDRTRIEGTAAELRRSHAVDVKSFVCDVTDAESVARFREAVFDTHKAAHILFTNAGGPPSGGVEEFAEADFLQALRLNLLSAIHLVREFLPQMKKQAYGRIIALTSISVKQPLPTLALSNVARVGVVAYIKSIATAVSHLNITANTLAPGYFLTDRVKELLSDMAKRDGISEEEALAAITASIPAKRVGAPEELGALVAFLASEQAGYISGDTILIDGGMYQGLM